MQDKALEQMQADLKQYKRLRWYVMATVVAGVAVSVSMNILHAPDSTWARVVAASPPVAVYGALEFIARIPKIGKWLNRARIFGAIIIGVGAASISYWQQKSAVRGLGFLEWESWVWPATVDGFMIVAAVSMVAVLLKIRELQIEIAARQSAADATVAGRRARADLMESPETIAFRSAMEARQQYQPVVLPVNGHKPVSVAASPAG